MALRLTPPTKNMFYLSSALAIIAILGGDDRGRLHEGRLSASD